MLASFAYTYHTDSNGFSLGRIATVEREDGTRWTYDYTNAHHHLTDARLEGPEGTLGWRYEYDGIGNRVSRELAEVPGSRVELDFDDANLLLARDNLGRVVVAGTYNGPGANLRLRVNGRPATLLGERFHAALEVDPASLPTNLPLRLSAAWEDTEGQDCASVATGSVFIPAQPPELLYTANGELADDGRNRYEWDGHGHLRAVVQTNVPPGRAWYRETYTYYPDGRLASRTTWHDPERDGSWTRDETRARHYDGACLVREDLRGPFGPAGSVHYVWGLDLAGQASGGYDPQGAGGVDGLLAVVEEPAGGGSKLGAN